MKMFYSVVRPATVTAIHLPSKLTSKLFPEILKMLQELTMGMDFQIMDVTQSVGDAGINVSTMINNCTGAVHFRPGSYVVRKGSTDGDQLLTYSTSEFRDEYMLDEEGETDSEFSFANLDLKDVPHNKGSHRMAVMNRECENAVKDYFWRQAAHEMNRTDTAFSAITGVGHDEKAVAPLKQAQAQ